MNNDCDSPTDSGCSSEFASPFSPGGCPSSSSSPFLMGFFLIWLKNDRHTLYIIEYLQHTCSLFWLWKSLKLTHTNHKMPVYVLDSFPGVSVACEQAPGGSSAEQTFGAKLRAIGACTHSPKSPMSASKIWTQSGDWWTLIIHDVVLVFTSGIHKNQNGETREEVLRSTSFRIFNIYQFIWSLGCNWRPNSVIQWSIY